MNSSVAAEKAGWRDRVVKASAQVRVGPGGGADEFSWVLSVVRERLAATDLQKSVLVGLEMHCAHVPGPLAQGLEVVGPLVICCLEETGRDDGGLASWCRKLSFDISAQMQGVPSEQKPQGSGGAVAGIDEDAVEDEVVRVGGRRVENWAVKSISVLLLSLKS